MSLKNKCVVVTGGSRGLGLGLVEALVDEGAKVWVVARNTGDLEKVRIRLGVETVSADITDASAANSILSDVHPQVLVLNAGAVPRMARLDCTSWEDFTATWDTDVKGGLYWMQAALNLPLAPGSRVLVSSSGAAEQGSPMSGGYGGAKRMLWLMAKYANGLSEQKGLDIRFQAIVPRQMVAGTGVGGAGSSAYALAMGIEQEAFLERYPAMPPRQFGNHVVRVLTDATYETALAIGIRGDTGITVLEEQAA
ncbi:SDR family oxidoreductase [Rhizobium calliandrae]|uniref:SDR family oxidoreductase n=1 Tax=Rhizobium calliandrae TaxID=1312182 RepID=A0ABT7KN73_9HYPH|nr:SDR family oxidoreductase [Rhizobium calliandrae]MDL2410068.1 SDR family oxidoreductase [Rhizobium calliandrae]